MSKFMLGGPSYYGGPFDFFQFGGSYGPPGEEPFFSWNTEVYSWGSLIADIFIWYLSACVIVFLFWLTKKK